MESKGRVVQVESNKAKRNLHCIVAGKSGLFSIQKHTVACTFYKESTKAIPEMDFAIIYEKTYAV